MAGFFGLFDYTKEGPGVKKEERKKKGFFSFFEIYFRNFWSFISVSAVYCLVSLLGVTNGLAKVGFTHIARSTTRGKHTFLLSDFFESIKKNFKQALILGCINAVVTVILALDVWYFWNLTSTSADTPLFGIIGLGVALYLLIISTFMKYYIWTMVITFELPIKKILKNSYNFVFLNLGKNILISVILGIFYVVLYLLAAINAIGFVAAAFLLICVLPGFKTSLVQANTFPAIKKYIIDPYYEEHKGEDIEKRLALGLEVSEDELNEEKTENIFTDSALSKEEL